MSSVLRRLAMKQLTGSLAIADRQPLTVAAAIAAIYIATRGDDE